MTRQLRRDEVRAITEQLRKAQGNVCALCGKPFTKKDYPCLDHDHETGFIRGVLHNTCNGIEGKLKIVARRGHTGVSAYDYLIGLGKYLAKHSTPQTKLIHPTHMTEAAKRELRNRKAREARKRAKAK